jgi:tRNA (mo5U34)-methyltransferase
MTVPWYQSVEIDGLIYHGTSDTPEMAKRLIGLGRLDGLDVLDVGASEGYFIFDSLSRGARSVTAIDIDVEKRNKFEQLCQGKHIADYQIKSVYDISGNFDVVFFLGVIYHLEHPLMAIQKIHSVCRPGATVYVESFVIDDLIHGIKDLPVAYYMQNTPINNAWGYGDTTNYWAPTTILLQKMFVENNFEIIDCRNYHDRSVMVCRRP